MTKAEVLNLLRDNRDLIRAKFHVTILAIFGSYAREDHSFNSDLDVLYKIEEEGKFGLLEIEALERFLRDLFDVPAVDLVNESYINPIIELEIQKDLAYV